MIEDYEVTNAFGRGKSVGTRMGEAVGRTQAFSMFEGLLAKHSEQSNIDISIAFGKLRSDFDKLKEIIIL